MPELTIGIRPELESSRLRISELAPPTSTIVTALPSGVLRIDARLAGLDADPVVRDQDLVVVTDPRRAQDLDAVDERAVVRAEVLDLPVLAVLPQSRVLPRHAHVGDEDLAIGACVR